jgi:hypothetical protein
MGVRLRIMLFNARLSPIMGVLSLLNKMLGFYSEGYILDIICYLSPGTPVFPPLKLTPRYN